MMFIWQEAGCENESLRSHNRLIASNAEKERADTQIHMNTSSFHKKEIRTDWVVFNYVQRTSLFAL